LAEKKMRFRAKNGAIREYIAPMRANQIARKTSDFKMDLIKMGTGKFIAKYVTLRWSSTPFRGE